MVGATEARSSTVDDSGTTMARATPNAPDRAVATPEIPSNTGTGREPRRCRMIQVRNRKNAPASRVSPEMNRAAPPIPNCSRLASMEASDWVNAVRSVAEIRPMTAATVAIAVTTSSQPAVRGRWVARRDHETLLFRHQM